MSKQQIAETVFKVAELLYRTWEKLPRVKILNQEATINVLNSTVDYSIALSIPPNFREIMKPITINEQTLIRASVSCLSPLPRTIRGAMKNISSKEGFIFYPELLPKDCDIISLNFTYKVGNAELINDLIDSSHAHDPSGSSRNEYWMQAQLKHPKVLIEKFGRFDVRDVDVKVGVSVLEELKTTVPNPFIKRLKTVFQILDETDPRQQWKAIPKLRGLASNPYSGQEFDILKRIETFFLPTSFCNFVEVIKDFRYSDCIKGKESYELPIEIIPKKMDIISRTDLTLEKPAAEGVLIYKEEKFKEELFKIF